MGECCESFSLPCNCLENCDCICTGCGCTVRRIRKGQEWREGVRSRSRSTPQLTGTAWGIYTLVRCLLAIGVVIAGIIGFIALVHWQP